MMMILSLLISAQFSFAMDIESTLKDAARRAYPPMTASDYYGEGFYVKQALGTVADVSLGGGAMLIARSNLRDPFSVNVGRNLLLSAVGAAYLLGNTGARYYSGILHDRDPGVFPLASLTYEVIKGSPGLGAAELEFRILDSAK